MYETIENVINFEQLLIVIALHFPNIRYLNDSARIRGANLMAENLMHNQIIDRK